jgi:hypothetical protein
LAAWWPFTRKEIIELINSFGELYQGSNLSQREAVFVCHGLTASLR